jgi:molybdate transport system substrate-binding protein
VRRLALAAALVALAITPAGCGGDADAGESGPLVVFAASSLREVAARLEPEAEYVFAGSDELAAQIRDGADADLFLSASGQPVADLRDAELVDEPVPFASNRLVVVVPEANPGGVSSFADLARRGLKLILGGEGVPVGDYAREALAAAGLEEALDNVVSLEEDVRGVLGKVALDEADAGIVYATDVAAAAGDVRVVDIPADVQPNVRYYAAVVGEGDRDAAEEYLERLRGEEGQRILADAGFTPR